uniref:Katanin p80 WD40 repeat-containing subunit B1 n=1 Tax=Triatoma dimidiata TaxID=72491 RepID=A0A0V0GA12_TRIDM
MALPTKRAWKLQDFVAHSANVTCLALGHKSGHVLVTGGDDKKVNLWAIGKPNCIMSLSGHTTDIQCVRFGHTENQVCAGSYAGALKIWDLEAARLLRTLTGHKASIRAIEFHPYGDFITSGSSDTSVKLWDIRKKGCIFTYKGHTLAVNSLKFSPDGQWIASAGQEGIVKLWDLRMGRMLKEFPDHIAAVNSVEFHPHEFLLASASQDNTLNFWDLEHFKLVSATGKEMPSTRCLHFSAGGECLYAGATDTLRVYAWEPARTITSLHIPWGKVQDIATADTKLIGASFHLANVSLWVVDTTLLVQNDSSVEGESSPVHMSPFSHGNSLRKSFNKQKPSPEAKKSLSVKTIEESERSETDPEDETIPEIPNVNDYRAIFQPNRAYPREPVRRHSTSREHQDLSDHESEFPIKLSSIHHSVSESNIPRTAATGSNTIQQRVNSKQNIRISSHSNTMGKPVLRETKSDRGIQSVMTPASTPVAAAPAITDDFVPMTADRPSGLDIDDFLPKTYQKGLSYSQTVPDMSEAEVLSSIMRGHDSLMAILESRTRNLQIVYSLWQNKDLKSAVDAAVNMSDNSVIVDFLGVITHKPGVWNLDICVIVLPAVYDLLKSKYETHMRVGCDALRLILRNFTPVIKTNVLSGSSAVGVDISREERYQKCVKCYNSLLSIRAFLLKRQTLQGPLGQSFRELHVSLQAIDAN